ncbi:MAG TPA: DUF2393 family protein [Terriglobales bacterium]|nr:DUF2393 family protein [Terriglobales bacterium]
MSEPITPLPSFGGASGGEQDTGPPVVPIAIGVIVVLIVIGILMFFGRRGTSQNTASATVDPYAANLKISDIAMSTAANFAGQEVTYIEGKITNAGSKTVNRVLVQVTFHDTLGQVAQKDSQQRLMVITTREPYIDTAPLSAAPLKPSQSRDFRLTFDHISAEWNQQIPELTITKVNTE